MRPRKAYSFAREGKPLKQVGVLGYGFDASGLLKVMLVTTRSTRRATVPKGWRIKGKGSAVSAAQEALEEAGITGRIGPRLGEFLYWKRLRTAFVPVTVTVYGLEVKRELATWKESGQRLRGWFTPEEAAVLVEEPGLSTLLLQARELLQSNGRQPMEKVRKRRRKRERRKSAASGTSDGDGVSQPSSG